MKHLLTFTLLAASLICFGQDHSSAYHKVVSLMKTELNYTYDSSSDKRVESKSDTARAKSTQSGIKDAASSTKNPSPIIILDGTPTELVEFDKYEADEIELYKTLSGTKSTALYGARAKNGVILLKRKK